MRNNSSALIMLFIMGQLFVSGAFADDEASNTPHVAIGEYGRCLAHSVPNDYYGTEGHTDIFVAERELKHVHRYDWYAPVIWLACNISDGAGDRGIAVARTGPWPRGSRPDDKTLALGIYFNGDERATFTTLEIADREPQNASCSVSHYTVIAQIEGFQLNAPNGSFFELLTVDGRRMTFDAADGALLSNKKISEKPRLGACP